MHFNRFNLIKHPVINQEFLKKLNIFKENSDFATAFEENYLSDPKALITINVYKNDLENLKEFEGLSYFQRKLLRLEKTLNQLLELNFEQNIQSMKEQLMQKTKRLTESVEIYNEEVRAYYSFIRIHQEQLKKITIKSLIEKLEKQLLGLIEDLPKVRPSEISHKYNWCINPPEDYSSLSPKIEVFIPDALQGESALIYHSYSWLHNQKHFGIDIWNKKGSIWEKNEYYLDKNEENDK